MRAMREETRENCSCISGAVEGGNSVRLCRYEEELDQSPLQWDEEADGPGMEGR